jgi:hypothetical protein
MGCLALLIAMTGCQERPGEGDSGSSESTEAASTDAPASADPLGESPGSLPARGITGFASLPWGSSVSDIVDRYGAPTDTVAGQGDVTIYAFANQAVLERDVLMGLVVHEQSGLFKGGYTIVVGNWQEALDVFYEFANTISFRYPGVPTVRCPAEKACEEVIAVPVDRAIQWSDATNQAAIAIALIEGSDSYQIRIDYETRAIQP